MKIVADMIEISNPLKGKKFNAAAPIPKRESKPIPHAAQPKPKTPKKIPAVAKNPVLPDIDLIILILYAMRLNNIPKKMPNIIKVIKTLRNVVFLKPTKKLKKNLMLLKNPNWL